LTAAAKALRQATALLDLSVDEASARLVLDWGVVAGVARQQAHADRKGWNPDQLFHSLRHKYASLCLAAGIRSIDIAALMGHRDVKMTLTVYAHLINTDDHTGNMPALGALVIAKPAGNVVPLRARNII
jgi:integrase